MICRKATVALPEANYLSSGANPSLPEHKIEVFVRFCPSEPSFSGFSSTKSAFLCSSRGTSGIGKRKSGLPAIHRAGFQNANTSEPDN